MWVTPALPSVVKDEAVFSLILKDPSAIERLDLVLHTFTVPLSRFEECARLRELYMRFVSIPVTVRSFIRPESLAALHTLSITGAFLERGVVETIAKLPQLRALSLTKSTIAFGDNLHPLTRASTLQKLTLTDLALDDRPPGFLLGQLHWFEKKLPHTEVSPVVVLPEHALFREVLTTNVTPTSFAPSDVPRVNYRVLQELLKANSEQQYWSQDFAWRDENRRYFLYGKTMPYDHNLMNVPFPFSGSPIACPDGRQRFPSQSQERGQ